MTGCNKKDPAENNNPLNGTFTRSIDVNGQVREYLIHIPNAYDGTQSVPIMLNFHGWNMSANDQMNVSDMRALSESEQFILVYPQGSLFYGSTHWNVGSWTTGSSSNDIGFIGDGKLQVKDITVAIYKTLINHLDTLKNNFEVVLVDEAHLCPAEMFSKVVNGLSARTKIALSATPTRKDGMHIVLSDYFGPNRITAIDKARLTPSVEVVRTDINFRIRNPARDWALALNTLARNDNYIDLICDTARRKIALGRCILIVSERIDMLNGIHEKLEGSRLLVGATKNSDREYILENAGKSITAILSTKIFDEGISCHRLDTIFFTCPQNNYAKLEQRIGRIVREHEEKKFPLIVDFWLRGPIVKNMQEKRLQWYDKQQFHIKSIIVGNLNNL